MTETGSWEDRTLAVSQVMGALGRLALPLLAGTVGLHLLLWGWPDADAGAWTAAVLWMLGAYLLAIVVHEALHVLPMFAAGLRPRDLRFGVRWADGVVFVHGTRPLSTRWYRIVLATPGLFLGVLPLILGLATGSLFLTVFAYLMLVSAVGDWEILRLIRDLDPDDLVQDHPQAVGCLVWRPDTPAE